MTDPDNKPDGGAENEKSRLEDSTAVDIDPLDESKAQLINGAAGGDHEDKYKTAIIDPGAASSDGEVSFNGLGKDEVMQYANDPFWVRLRWVLFILFWVGWLAMLVTAVAIIVLAPRCPPRPDLKWYNTEVVYQVFPKSFKDSNQDGLGDFGGLDDKKDYLEDQLGIKSMWISAMYKSDGTEGSGLDVVDHKDIEDYFGVTVDKMRGWMKDMLKEGKRVILDLIPNQTGRNHTWFKKSQAGEKDFEKYYIWAPNTGGPPNSWKRRDSTSPWVLDTTKNQYYYAGLGDDLPDLNLRNAAVVEEIKDIMKFWFDAGVSGFNIRDVEYLMESEDLDVDYEDTGVTTNHPDTFPFLEELRKVANSFSDKPGRERVLFATVYSASRNETMDYFGTDENKRLHIVSPIMSDFSHACDAVCIKDLVEKTITDKEKQWTGLQFGNEHLTRIASRMDAGDGTYKQRLMVAQAIQLLLPGTAFNYYGDEFGQRDSTVASGDESNKFRGPLQWNKQENAGFTDPGVTPWNPVSSTYKQDNVEAGLVHFEDMTPLQNFHDLAELRTNASFQWGKTTVCAISKDLLIFSRKAHRFPFYVTFLNLGERSTYVSPKDLSCVPSKKEGVVRFHSRDKMVEETIDVEEYGVHLKGLDIVVVEFPADE